MSKHTPGPWPKPEYENDVGPHDDYFIEWWGIEGVCKVDKKEDAYLIAAAPDLLEALAFMLSVFNETYPDVADDEEDREAWAKARAAIRKATGE